MVFDKTGTLTEDCLQMQGLRGISGSLEDQTDQTNQGPQFTDFAPSIKDLVPQRDIDNIKDNLYAKKVLLNEGMACCQSVTYVKEELLGDPLEIKMLEDTEWELDEAGTVGNSQIGGDDIVLAYVHPKRVPDQ